MTRATIDAGNNRCEEQLIRYAIDVRNNRCDKQSMFSVHLVGQTRDQDEWPDIARQWK